MKEHNKKQCYTETIEKRKNQNTQHMTEVHPTEDAETI